ncbi:DNA gyrase subunit A [Bdellovibrio sp. SKB1291214]|uniref:DNA gyrase subunit A n=1 Tax=Bdellovibrio sp. SKB1291214 TaxID=1732569 RepID=UPI000B5150E5|nr:DNA gyrase subunit A [Bdellovibrio sp. SKB1291214]UYL10547.1 DNA gyrase subunit A [Bdellovibrio sp. SKB1291214]
MENSNQEKGVTVVDISKEMRGAYLQYSMSVIVGRALPDVRDGLKPVHRRVLFAQSEMNNRHNRPYLKSARVVGDVIGKYHPHGDSAVYETMVRMAQDFSLRYPLEDGQGNFGSIDGDSAAAMRYTEIRMTPMAEELLNDLEKETVSFGPNYDDSLQIPLVLPAKFPNLLVNGSSGIAVGMATNIPPHNLGEVIDGTIHLINNPQCQLEDLMVHIKGPDFPSAGVIAGREGILQAYKKGRGIISLKAVAEITPNKDREDIIITEIPYQVNKAKLIESIADLVRDKAIEGISDIRDESSREGMRIVINLKRGENASVILNRLYKFTQMQVSVGIIMLALDAKNQPVTFDLKGMLEAFVDHRRDVVTKRCIFELKKAQERAHILEGLKKALDHIEEVIKTIRASKEAHAAREALMSKFEFSERQAIAILEMRLQRLTGLERDKIIEELAELQKQIDWLKFVLADVREIYKIIVGELEDMKKRYADPRRTQLQGSLDDIEDEDLIADEDMVVTVTNTGLIKRMPTAEYRVQKRGGKGLKGMETKEEDYVTDLFSASTKTMLLVFTDKGKVYWVKVHKLPLGSRTSKGKSLANVVQLASGESVRAILPVNEFDENKFAVMLTEKGVIKKTSMDSFANPRTAGVIALTTDLDDAIIDVKISDGQSDIFIATKEGMSIRFNENDVRGMGRTARGVKAITLAKDDVVVAMEVLEKNTPDTILMVTSKGYGKRSEVGEYRVQSRGGVGIITQKTTDKVGNVVGTKKVSEKHELILSTDKGQVIRMKMTDISVLGRNTQGVRLINIDEKEETVTGLAVVEDDHSDETASAPTAPEGVTH